ncbi:MAG: hypothetical protein ABIP13_06170 [Tepidiformaceae bacterium]
MSFVFIAVVVLLVAWMAMVIVSVSQWWFDRRRQVAERAKYDLGRLLFNLMVSQDEDIESSAARGPGEAWVPPFGIGIARMKGQRSRSTGFVSPLEAMYRRSTAEVAAGRFSPIPQSIDAHAR